LQSTSGIFFSFNLTADYVDLADWVAPVPGVRHLGNFSRSQSESRIKRIRGAPASCPPFGCTPATSPIQHVRQGPRKETGCKPVLPRLHFGHHHLPFPIPETGGIAQLVERQLCKLEVRGSNPLASSLRSRRREERRLSRRSFSEGGSSTCVRNSAFGAILKALRASLN
jgi:hypothetical protein